MNGLLPVRQQSLGAFQMNRWLDLAIESVQYGMKSVLTVCRGANTCPYPQKMFPAKGIERVFLAMCIMVAVSLADHFARKASKLLAWATK